MKEEGSNKDRLTGLYRDLAKYGSIGEYEKALSTAHKILNLNSEEYEAYFSVIVALIRLERFQDALKFMDSQERKYGELFFHKAYIFYRLNRPAEALEVLKKEKKPDAKYKELEAQILYRLERYDEALSVYEGMDVPKDDDFELERETNMSAAKVFTSPSSVSKKDCEDSYELLYNKGCCLIADKKYSEAEKCLRKAESMCKALLKEENDEIDEEELEKETGIINVQIGYALQSQGKVKEAQVLYNQVLKTKPTDIGLVAVASNNLITLNKDQNIFDSRKRIKAATVEGLEHKLTSTQRRSIAYNSALLAMYTNQIEACKTLIDELDKNFGLKDKNEKDLILSGVLSRSGKRDEAIQILMSSSVFQLEHLLIAVQLLLEKKDFKGALKLMEDKLPEEIKYKTGILSTMVVLYMAVNDRASAAKLLKQAVSYNSKYKKSDRDMSVVWKKTAEFHLRGGELTVAAQSLEELLKTNPNDHILLAQLVLAYAEFDLNKALQASKKLPEFKEVTLDINALESTAFFGGNKKVPKVGGLPSPDPKKENVDLLKKKKRKKKKKKLPKNYDPNVEPDPERWIPKRERMAYRKHLKRERRNKGEKFTGAQGTAQGQSDSFDYSSKKATPKSPGATPQPSVGPRQQQRRHQPQKKKKKKGF